jgi:hypothetical protein
VAEALAFLGVTAIVTHANALHYNDRSPDVPRASWGPGYQLLTRTSDGSSVWRVVASPAPALATLYGGFGDPQPPEQGTVGFPLISSSGVGEVQLRAKEPGVVRLTFHATPPEGRTQVLRVSDEHTEVPFTLRRRTRVSVLVRIPTGLSRVLVKTDPAATSQDDAILVTVPRVTRSSGSPALEAESLSPNVGFG